MNGWTKDMVIILLGSVVVSLAAQSIATASQNWEAPEDAKARKNPLEATAEVINEGQALYKKNCQMCHGFSGKGDGPATRYVKPAPADLTPPETQAALTDGEIFWKITVGKKPMPPYGKKLSEEERWKLVHFVRTLKAD